VISHSSLSNYKRKKKRILYVDDETDMTAMLKMVLERAGFTIDTFNDPLLAQEL
jgi:DNA-binding response OmpR family regulator